jgi:hypothetical protein
MSPRPRYISLVSADENMFLTSNTAGARHDSSYRFPVPRWILLLVTATATATVWLTAVQVRTSTIVAPRPNKCATDTMLNAADVIYTGVGFAVGGGPCTTSRGWFVDANLLSLLHKMRLSIRTRVVRKITVANSVGAGRMPATSQDPLEELVPFHCGGTRAVGLSRIPPSHSSLLPASNDGIPLQTHFVLCRLLVA